MAHMHSRAVAISPRLSGVHDNLVLQFELGSAAEGLAQDLGLVTKLRGVVYVLVVAATAARKVRATGFDPFVRRRDDLLELRTCESRTSLNDRRLDLLSRQNEWKKNSLAPAMFVSRQARQAISPINQFIDRKLQRLSCLVGLSRNVIVRRRPAMAFDSQ